MYKGEAAIIGSLTDITERKKIEAMIIKGKEEWEKTFDSVSDLIALIDTEHRIVRVNMSLARKLGMHPRDAVGQLCYELMFGQDEPTPHCLFDEVLKEGKVYTAELHIDKLGGDYALSISPLPGSQGETVGTVLVAHDITDRKRAEEAMRESREQLRSLSAYLQSVREEERFSIAREIHDELGQLLTALKMDVSWLKRKLRDTDAALSEKAASTESLADSGIRSVRRIISELRPYVLDELGIVEAVQWQTHQFEERTGIGCKMAIDKSPLRVDKERSTAIFRILQESLTNVARYSRASEVRVELKKTGDDIMLRVTDNGIGIPEGRLTAPRSFGLIGMRERALNLSGKVDIKRADTGGTTVEARIPLKEKATQ
jgi:PAS domain S-box-containing protein